MSNDFAENWAFPSEVLKSIKDARWHDTRSIPGNYSSGRPKFQSLFLSADKSRIVARRPAMELTSKAGNKYFVCARKTLSERSAANVGAAVDAILSKPGREPLGLDDVFD
jgi:hypothetical protein